MNRNYKIALALSIFVILGVCADITLSYAFFKYGDTEYFVKAEQNRYVCDNFVNGTFPSLFFIKIPFFIIPIVASVLMITKVEKEINFKKIERQFTFSKLMMFGAFISLGLSNFAAGLSWYDEPTNIMTTLSRIFNDWVYLFLGVAGLFALIAATSLYRDEKKSH